MADAVYPKILEALATKAVSFTADNVKWLLVSAGYTFSTSHQYISDLGANIVARSPNLTGKSATNGALVADAATALAVTGAAVTQLVLAFDTGNDATSRLICKITTYAGLPLTPSGADVPITPANPIMTV